MRNIVHARIDYRLIHGQVITKWIKQRPANTIVIIDDLLASDEFLGTVYKMAAPTGIEVTVTTVADALARWNSDDFFGSSVFLLFKNIDTALAAINQGLILTELQVGGLENTVSRKIVHNQISMDMADYVKLEEIESSGTHVYFQTVPGEEISVLGKIRKKL